MAQVVAPDLLHQLGVVPALDPDARGAGDLRRLALDRVGARRRHPAPAVADRSGAGPGRGPRRVEDHGPTVDPEARPQWEAAARPAAVLQDDDAAPPGLLRGDDGPHEAGLAVLDDEPPADGHVHGLGPDRIGAHPVRVDGQDVATVAVGGGGPNRQGWRGPG